MRGMITPSISWKMAWRNLRSQRRQTLLTIAGGCIGAALIMASIIFFQSFDESGSRWLKKHYGPIDWELRPPNNNPFFTSEELPSIEQLLKPNKLQQLPVVTFETRVSKVDGNLQTVRTGMRYLGIGLDFLQASTFDKENSLWNLSLSPNQIVLSDAIAKPLEIIEGDTVALTDAKGEKHFYQVRKIVKEEGISGYRGSTSTEGTLLIGLSDARQLAGIPIHTITSIFVGTTDKSLKKAEPSHFPIPAPLFEVREQKQLDFNQVQQMKKKHGFTFVLCSITAILAGALLMIQILLMLADARKESTALLRAIGFQRRHTQTFFLIEAFLINLLSTGVGIALGIPLGSGIILLFGWLNRNLIFAYSAHSVAITPYISLGGILLTGAIVLTLLMLTSVIACYKLGNLKIVATLRGENIKAEPRRVFWYAGIRIGLTLCSAVILGIHIVQLVTGKGIAILTTSGNTSTIQSAYVLALWFLSSISLLYIIVQILPYIQKLLKPLLNRLGIGEAAQILAFRYPAGNYRRTFVVTLLFSCCFMLLTLIIIITQHNYREIEQKSYTVLGYPAYIKYSTDSEKQQIISILNEDPELGKASKNSPVMEPYMIQAGSDGAILPNSQLSLTIPSDAFLQSNTHKLSERSADFASDDEAWKAVLNNPHYVILDKKYSYAPEEWSTVYGMEKEISAKINVGDKLKLNIYEKPAGPNTSDFGKKPQLKNSIDIKIIGFADTSTGMEFYNVMFVHPQIYEKLKAQGYHWENTSEKGYIMLPLPSKDLSYLRKIEEHVVAEGINGFYAPGITEASEDISTIQMLWIFNGFMILAMGIGLAGLAILQFRAVQERSKTIAMMRCIGLSTRLVRQMILLEGTMIGWIGLLNGCLFGSIGGYITVRLLESTKKPTDPILHFYYPWEFILPIACALMLLTLLLNLEPSRRILRLSPSEAIRSADE